MRVLKSRKSKSVVAGAAVLVLGGGAAFAWWSSTGTTDTTGTTGASAGLTVAATPALLPLLTPGGPSQTVNFTVTNPGTGSQMLSNVAVTVANPDGSAWTVAATPAGTGCSALDYTVGTPTITYGQIAPAGSVAGTVTLTMNNRAADQDDCQLKSVPLHIVAS